VRIVGGDFGGRRLAALGKGDDGARLRPTTDRVRESLMNMLSGGRFGTPFAGTAVLDLFAGTGALGLEALSRGAAFCTFVDNGRAAQRLIRANVATLQVGDRTRLLTGSALRLPRADSPASLVFLDPPYGKGLGTGALSAARAGGWIARGTLVVWEDSTPQAAPEGFATLEDRRFGDSVVTLLRA
jgi:16S rRNA (guanine966-N2)-methyltransferase